jgi:hypothetical protein
MSSVSKSASAFKQNTISKCMMEEYGATVRFSWAKMKRPGIKPDLLTLALHGPSTFGNPNYYNLP